MAAYDFERYGSNGGGFVNLQDHIGAWEQVEIVPLPPPWRGKEIIMSISLSHKLGGNADAVRRLYSGELPTDEDERWNWIDGPRYGLEQLIQEHERALSILAACQTNKRPFCLFLRNFSLESPDGSQFHVESSRFQGWLTGHLAVRNVPVIKLHGGSDAFIPIEKFNVNTGERPDRRALTKAVRFRPTPAIGLRSLLSFWRPRPSPCSASASCPMACSAKSACSEANRGWIGVS
jgi:hypothetical protein